MASALVSKAALPMLKEGVALEDQDVAALAHLSYVKETLELARSFILAAEAAAAVKARKIEDSDEEGGEAVVDTTLVASHSHISERCHVSHRAIEDLMAVLKNETPPSVLELELTQVATQEAFPEELMDLVEENESRERRRKRTQDVLQLTNELLNTEKTYVHNLQMLIDYYYEPTLKEYPDSTLMEIFSNIPSIHTFNKELSQTMNSAWAEAITPEVKEVFQRDSTELNEAELEHDMEVLLNLAEKQAGIIGRVITQMAPFLKCYTQYVNNYDNAMKVLGDHLSQRRTKNWINGCDKKAQRAAREHKQLLRLSDYLIMPIQRVPRYVMLLKALLRKLDANTPESEIIKEALQAVSIVADGINATKKERDDLVRLVDLAQKITVEGHNELHMNFVKPGRRLLKEGELMRGEDRRYVFLFSDLILETNQIGEGDKVEFIVETLNKLDEAVMEAESITEASDGEEKVEADEQAPSSMDSFSFSGSNEFSLVVPFLEGVKATSIKVTYRGRSDAEVSAWMDALEIAIDEARRLKGSHVFQEYTNESIDDDMLEPVTMSGWLMKRRDNLRTWRPRFFKLKGSTLFYFTEVADNAPSGILNLRQYSVNIQSRFSLLGYLHGGKHSFELKHKVTNHSLFFKISHLHHKTADIWHRLWLTAFRIRKLEIDPEVWEHVKPLNMNDAVHLLEKRGYKNLMKAFLTKPEK